MATRLKFKCTQLTKNAGTKEVDGKWVPCELGGVILYPVMDGSAENKEFYRYTPAGSINFSTINEDALAQFVIGQEYYITVEKA